MPQFFSARAQSLVMPLALLVAAFYAVTPLQELPAQRLFLVELMPYVTAALAGVIALMFNQSRLFCLALLLGLGFWLLSPARQWLDVPVQTFLYSVILPLNLVAFSALREKGLFNGNGALLCVALMLQVGLAGWLGTEHPLFFERLSTPFLQSVVPLSPSVDVPHGGLLVLLLALVWLAWRHWRGPSVLNATLLLMPAALVAALHWREVPVAAETVFSTMALMLSLGIILEIHRIAYRDDLTGLPARRALNLRLAAPGRQYMIAMLDVDHFKKFNDRYGHDVGDEVLRMVSARLQRVGGGGKAYRYGGEEFTIVFSGNDLEKALDHLEQLRETIAGYRLALRSKDRPAKPGEGRQKRGRSPVKNTVSVTISMGLAQRNENHRQPQAVLKAADKALYRAKGAGRNQVCCAQA